MTCAVKMSKFYDNQGFVFPVEAFQFSKYHKNEAKRDKSNLKKGLTVTFTVKN